jgi:hypothetical protein
MGGGSTILLLYGGCCGVLTVVVGVAAFLYGWGRLSERRARRKRGGAAPRDA